MEILIIRALEKPSTLDGVRVFDGITVSGEKCLILKTCDDTGQELEACATSEEWRPIWMHGTPENL
jgi:hypothetical protein